MKFTIIMPFYNSSTYIRDAVLSVVNQTYRNWELIAVNDGSTDNSQEIVESFNDDRIKIIYKENGGYSTAVNYGLSKVTGDYFMMLGSDDKLFVDSLHKIACEAEKQKPDIIACKVVMHYQDKDIDDKTDPSTFFEKKIFYNGSFAGFCNDYSHESFFLGLRDTGKIYKSSVLSYLRYFGSYGYDADGIFSLLFAHNCKNYMIIPVNLYFWTIRGESLSGRPLSILIQIERLKNWVSYLCAIDKYNVNDISFIDVAYSKQGHNIIYAIALNNFRYILKYYFTIRKYYFLLTRFCIKLKRYDDLKGNFFLYLFFPLLYYSLLRILVMIKKET